ncbi:MAG: c-type cytochrome [Nitrospinota bacterium]
MRVGFFARPVEAANPSRRKRALGVLGALWLFLLGCGSDVERGAGIYAQRCLPCHGTQGAGDGSRAAFLPKGAADLRASRLSDGDIRLVVTEGRGLMPAFGPALEEDEIRDVLAFVKRFRKE